MCDDLGIPENMLVYKITFDGSYLICSSIQEVNAIIESDFEDMEEGSKVTIKRIKMTDKSIIHCLNLKGGSSS